MWEIHGIYVETEYHAGSQRKMSRSYRSLETYSHDDAVTHAKQLKQNMEFVVIGITHTETQETIYL